MRLKALGCSGGIGAGLRTTCFGIDGDILIDAGTGLGDLTLAEMGDIRHIFLTHSHLDHVTGIPFMADSVFERLMERPVTVHGRPETLEALRAHVFNWVIWPDFTALPAAGRGVIRLAPMTPGEVVDLDGRRIEMLQVNHAVPAAGYRISGDAGAVAISGDTTTNDDFWDGLNRRDGLAALVIETAFPDEELELCRKAYHYCPRLLCEDLAKLRHRPTVYLTHLKPGAEDQILAQCRAHMPDLELRALCGGDVIPV